MEELRIVREEASRWESRVNELLLKYGSVDLAEHNRVADALKVGFLCCAVNGPHTVRHSR